MPKVMTSTQQFDAEAKITDRRGRPANVQDPVWASSDPAILAVEVDPANPLKATAKAASEGPVMLSFTADADLGEGVKPLTATLDIVVGPAEAAVFEIVAGEATEQA